MAFDSKSGIFSGARFLAFVLEDGFEYISTTLLVSDFLSSDVNFEFCWIIVSFFDVVSSTTVDLKKSVLHEAHSSGFDSGMSTCLKTLLAVDSFRAIVSDIFFGACDISVSVYIKIIILK